MEGGRRVLGPGLTGPRVRGCLWWQPLARAGVQSHRTAGQWPSGKAAGQEISHTDTQFPAPTALQGTCRLENSDTSSVWRASFLLESEPAAASRAELGVGPSSQGGSLSVASGSHGARCTWHRLVHHQTQGAVTWPVISVTSDTSPCTHSASLPPLWGSISATVQAPSKHARPQAVLAPSLSPTGVNTSRSLPSGSPGPQFQCQCVPLLVWHLPLDGPHGSHTRRPTTPLV